VSNGLWWSFGAAVATAAVADLSGARVLFAVALVALMPLLMAVLVTTSRRLRLAPGGRRLVALTLAALLFSWLGDATGPFFLLKVALFLVAQCCYVAAFWPHRRESVWRQPGLTATYLTAVAVGVGVVVPYAGALAVPVVVYAASLALMATLATGVDRVAGWGGALFVLSDAILALDRFVGWSDLSHPFLWNVLTYATSQALLVWGVLRRSAASAPAPAVSS
jgi:uncharacterized membrane protein YhhN